MAPSACVAGWAQVAPDDATQVLVAAAGSAVAEVAVAECSSVEAEEAEAVVLNLLDCIGEVVTLQGLVC